MTAVVSWRDVVLRPLSPADAVLCAALSRSRGWSNGEDRWRFLLGLGGGVGAWDGDGRLVGSVLLTDCTAEVSAVGSMIVAADCQRRGIGGLLLEAALARASGSHVMLWATAHGLPLYRRFGFWESGALVQTRREGGVRTPPGGGSRALSAAELDVVGALDTQAHGGARPRLLPALAGFAAGPGTGLRVLEQDGDAMAFGATWRCTQCTMLGPLVAADDVSGLALLADLVAITTGPMRADVRADRAAALGWLAGHGFARSGGTTLMVRGRGGLPGDERLVWAPVNQSLT